MDRNMTDESIDSKSPSDLGTALDRISSLQDELTRLEVEAGKVKAEVELETLDSPGEQQLADALRTPSRLARKLAHICDRSP